MLLGVMSGALWTEVTSFGWYADVAYDAPSFAEGHWWTILTGAFFGLTPVFYLPIVTGFALRVGSAEYRMGTARVALLTVGGHLFGTLGAAAMLQLLAGHGWAWSDQIVLTTDVGPSAGMVATAAAATALVRAAWRMGTARAGDLCGRVVSLHRHARGPDAPHRGDPRAASWTAVERPARGRQDRAVRRAACDAHVGGVRHACPTG